MRTNWLPGMGMFMRLGMVDSKQGHVVGHFSAYSASRHGLAMNGHGLATIEAAPTRWAGSDAAYAAPVDRLAPFDRRDLPVDLPTSAPVRRDAVSTEVAMMRAIHLSVVKLRIGLCTFVVCGVLSGFAMGWSLLVSVVVGLLLAAIVGPLAGSFFGPRTFRIPPWTGAMIASQAGEPTRARLSDCSVLAAPPSRVRPLHS